MNIEVKNAFVLLSEKLSSWYEGAVKSIPNIAVAIVILTSFFILAVIVKRVSDKIFYRLTRNRAVANLMKSILSTITILIGLFISLEILQLEKTVTSILAGAGVIGLALGFAFQEIASNFFAGVLIAFRKPYQLGDIIEIDDFFGEVTDINLRTTSITSFDGLETIIPNKDMFTKPFTNFTTTPKRRVSLDVGVSYGEDLVHVEKVTREALESISERDKDSDVDVYFKEFGDSSINLIARFWIEYPKNSAYLKARHVAIMNIKKAYDENGITIPFPIRTLDFGIKGGEKLSETIESSLKLQSKE